MMTAAAIAAKIALLMKTQLIAALAAIAIGASLYAASPRHPQAPEVRFVTLSGKSLTTADLRGKVVLVNFWATWCPDCVKEMPKLTETYRKFAPRGYRMVAVAVHSHPNQVAAFASSRALPFQVALDLDGAVAKSFGNVHITPTSFLIGKDGRIIGKYVGEPDWKDLDAAVEKALGS